MPVFEIEAQGRVFQVEAPDQTAAMSALDAMPSPENSVAGSAKALGSGLVRGGSMLAGLPADIADIASKGFDYVSGQETNKSVGPAVQPFGSESIQKAIESKTGELYKPQTTLEKYLGAVGEFGPAALLGPGGIVRRVATQVVAPAVASEAAGQLTEGTSLEPAARIAGALTGAVGAGKAASALTRPRPSPSPSRETIDQLTSAGYKDQSIKDLRISPLYADKVADAGIASLKRSRFDANGSAKQVYSTMDDLRAPQFGASHTLEDFDNVRKRLGEMAGSQDKTLAKAATQAIRTIDAATLRVPQRFVVQGDARAAAGALFDARRNAAVGFRSDKVREALERASNTATATHSGGNLENEIYKQIRTMLNNPRKHLRGWSQEERDALRAILPGIGRNALRRAGKVMGGGGGLGQLASGSAGGAMFGFPGMFALPALGMAANRAGSAIAESKLRGLDELIRSRATTVSPQQRALRLLPNGLFEGVPGMEQLAFQSMLALRPQLPQYQGR